MNAGLRNAMLIFVHCSTFPSCLCPWPLGRHTLRDPHQACVFRPPQPEPEQELASANGQGSALEPSSDPAWPRAPAGRHSGDPGDWAKALAPSVNLSLSDPLSSIHILLGEQLCFLSPLASVSFLCLSSLLDLIFLSLLACLSLS